MLPEKRGGDGLQWCWLLMVLSMWSFPCPAQVWDVLGSRAKRIGVHGEMFCVYVHLTILDYETGKWVILM